MRAAVTFLLLTGCGFEGARVDPPTDGKGGESISGSEAGIDATGCPADYNALPNSGPRGHRYRLSDALLSWQAHRDGCVAMGTFIAFPDGPDPLSEIGALRTLAGNGAWIGVSDIVTEGQYRNSLGALISTQTQALMLGGNTGTDDCTIINNTAIDPESCNINVRAVCECVP